MRSIRSLRSTDYAVRRVLQAYCPGWSGPLNTLPQHPNFVNITSRFVGSSSTIEVPPAAQPVIKDCDEFGTLGGLQYEKIPLDEDEAEEEERLKNVRTRVPRKFKPSTGQYVSMIKHYLEKGDLKSAEEVMNQCKMNKDKPNPYMYTLMIRAYALQGDIIKCYKYFNGMKSRGYEIKQNVYTSLFNACGNFPESNKALDYINRVKSHMENNKCPMNHAHYNVLVKAYGRHYRLDKANELVQVMIDKKMKIGISTINSLMYAANSDVESGLKHVLYYWHLMRKKKIPPDMFTYNLLLRAIRDTNFGDFSLKNLLTDGEDSTIVTDRNRSNLLLYPPMVSPLPFGNTQKDCKTHTNDPVDLPAATSIETSDTKSLVPRENILESLPDSIKNLDFNAIIKQNKLILFGGVDGILNKMKEDRIVPNIKTVTYLIELVPNSVAAENEVIKYAREYKIPLDIDFFNMLIKKRAVRGAKNDAMAVLDMIHLSDLRPNIMTYGVMAMACATTKESRDLLKAMDTTGHPLNKYVANALLNSAISRIDFIFIMEILQRIYKEGVRIDDDTYEKLDDFQHKMTQLVKTNHPRTKKETFKSGFSKFNMRYKSWQEEMGRKIVTEFEEKKKK
ncbi:hypothetical protein QAD02_023542 [Eretmocerus hayati]|uniref:Uncharacterized protein n=1 Tax=Eretmocerus hayati TaxID=131215 RepID=A0ACC2PXR5_9HYME|nr:hypothetical protein QAD02_023542 [Eretmocerus hayati]